jgi:adenylate cyclase
LRTPPRILAVDDAPANLEILKVRLEAHGYEVVTAADGEEALVRAREIEPDLVLLDVMLPKLDGISVLKSWSRKSEQDDKWSFCLIAGTLCPANQERQ